MQNVPSLQINVVLTGFSNTVAVDFDKRWRSKLSCMRDVPIFAVDDSRKANIPVNKILGCPTDLMITFFPL